MWGKTYPIYLYFSVIIIGNSPKYIQSITTMNKLILFASALAVLGRESVSFQILMVAEMLSFLGGRGLEQYANPPGASSFFGCPGGDF